MDNELEKAKQDLAAAVDAGLKLAEILNGACLPPETRGAIATLKALKPERFRCWVNTFPDGSCAGYAHKGLAKSYASDSHARIAVHMREVTTTPKWERWDSDRVNELHGENHWKRAFQDVADAHNAEMERLAALWEGGADE